MFSVLTVEPLTPVRIPSEDGGYAYDERTRSYHLRTLLGRPSVSTVSELIGNTGIPYVERRLKHIDGWKCVLEANGIDYAYLETVAPGDAFKVRLKISADELKDLQREDFRKFARNPESEYYGRFG